MIQNYDMPAEYERIIKIDGNTLRIVVKGEFATAYHNDKDVASRSGDVGLLIFKVIERGKRVTYDIAVLRSGYIRIFVGRDGVLIYSDDPALRVKGPGVLEK